MPKMDNDKLDEMVLYFLSRHVGEQNKIDRWTLAERVYGVSIPAIERNDKNSFDRNVRESVSRLRNRGELICDVGNGQGRWMAANIDEFWKFYAYFVSPISAKAYTARVLKKAALQKFNQQQPSLWSAPIPVAEDFEDLELQVPA
jgi:hypothetical protein